MMLMTSKALREIYYARILRVQPNLQCSPFLTSFLTCLFPDLSRPIPVSLSYCPARFLSFRTHFLLLPVALGFLSACPNNISVCLNMSLYLFHFLPVSMCVSFLSISIPVSLYIYHPPPKCLSFYLSKYLNTHLFHFLSNSLPVYHHTCLSLSVYFYTCLSLYTSLPLMSLSLSYFGVSSYLHTSLPTSLFLFLSLYESLSMCLSLCVSLSMCLSLHPLPNCSLWTCLSLDIPVSCLSLYVRYYLRL